MTPQDHYRAAEVILDALVDTEHHTERTHALAEAQVHATLAACGAPAAITVGPDEWLVLAFPAGGITQAEAHRLVSTMPDEIAERVTLVAGADTITVRLDEPAPAPAPSCYLCGTTGDLIDISTPFERKAVHRNACPITVEVTR